MDKKSSKTSMLFPLTIIFLAILLLGGYLFYTKKVVVKERSVNKENLSFEVFSIYDSTTFSSNSSKGKPVLLHFFASWCPPCRAEFPNFIEWTKKRSDSDDLVIIPISLDAKKEDAIKFVSKYPSKQKIYIDDGKVANKFSVEGIPATILIDKDGKVVLHKEGILNWESGEVDNIVEKLKGAG